jgi:DNA polymerase-3 subunit beta
LKTANDTEIKLQISSNHIRVQTASVRFTSKLIDGRYPDYKGAIPITFSTELNLDRLQFKSSLQRVSILSNEKFKGVKVSLSNNLMVIESNNPEQETAKEEIDISYSGEAFDIGFNVTYLLDAINHLKGETAVLCLNTTESSVLLFDPENEATRYIVMPIKL